MARTPQSATRAAAARPRRLRRLARCGPAVALFFAVLSVTQVASASAPSTAAGVDPHAASAGSIGLRLLDAPADTVDDPRARIYIVDHLAPGAVIHRRIELSNSTASPALIALYPAAATIAKGSFLGSVGHTPNDLSTWTSVSPDSSDVAAGGIATATITVAVPSDAAPGEQYGVVWAEVRATPTADGLTQVSRVGIRLYVSIGPGGPPAADFAVDSLTGRRSADGSPMVLATVHNLGGRALDMSGTLRLAGGPGGLSAGPFPVTLGTTLAIGDTERVTIALDKALPAGPWDARVKLRSGLLERRAQASIVFPGAGAAVASTPAQRGWLYPVIAGVLVVLALAASVTLLRRRRRRARGRSTDALPRAA